MYTRRTHDYTPTMKGSKQEQAAINARKEMLATFAEREPVEGPRRKTWDERMAKRAKKFELR